MAQNRKGQSTYTCTVHHALPPLQFLSGCVFVGSNAIRCQGIWLSPHSNLSKGTLCTQQAGTSQQQVLKQKVLVCAASL